MQEFKQFYATSNIHHAVTYLSSTPNNIITLMFRGAAMLQQQKL